MMLMQEKFSFVPLIKYKYAASPEELKAAEKNFTAMKDLQGQMISSNYLLNVTGEDKLIEVVAVNSNANYLFEISKLEDIAQVFGWKVIVTMNPNFGNFLI